MSGTIIRLLKHPLSDDTIRALEHLLSEARAGRVTGLAYVAIHNPRDYSVDLAGEAKRSPTLTRGMVQTLDDELSQIVRAGE